MSVLMTKNLSFSYPGKEPLFRDICIDINEGEALAINGPSGCGKSTLLYCMCGIIPRTFKGTLKGDIFICGKHISDIPRCEMAALLGIVFQNPECQLFCDTVEDEIAFGPENLCLSKEEIGSRIDEALQTVGMERYRYTHPEKLSGGQKQLVAIASVLALRPRILLFDEVMSQIDSAGKELVLDCINRLKRDGHTFVMVDHDSSNLSAADRILNLLPLGGVENG